MLNQWYDRSNQSNDELIKCCRWWMYCASHSTGKAKKGGSDEVAKGKASKAGAKAASKAKPDSKAAAKSAPKPAPKAASKKAQGSDSGSHESGSEEPKKKQPKKTKKSSDEDEDSSEEEKPKKKKGDDDGKGKDGEGEEGEGEEEEEEEEEGIYMSTTEFEAYIARRDCIRDIGKCMLLIFMTACIAYLFHVWRQSDKKRYGTGIVTERRTQPYSEEEENVTFLLNRVRDLDVDDQPDAVPTEFGQAVGDF
ncbi:uncharacterized protein [Dermacentor andersoni]|uniref:uncharacterized protein n=1 Tax=Dermacentor andersoni TaxID=34620 RepID=UPI003B3B3A22